MYTQKDIDSIQGQLRQRIILWLVPAVLLLAGIIYSYTLRLEWLSGVLTALLMAMLVFAMTLSILPVKQYRDFLRNAVHGRNREETLVFDLIQSETVIREGVRFYPVTMRADTIKEELDERQFYFDANLPLPDWKQGERLNVRSHEKMVTGWQRST
ncbi:MAG: hypothetical protein GX171_02830 [Clostridiales bacterium]|jgi:hypothetical protein|nr:hypothetical protein [Clostridiales bacterium]